MEELIKFFSSLEFSSPLYFWVGGAVVILLIFLPILKMKNNLRWDRGYWVKKVPRLKGRKPWMLFILMGFISLLIAAALANLQMVEKRSIPPEGKPVMILIDVSGSMYPYSHDHGGYGGQGTFSVFQEVKNVYYDIIKQSTGATIGLAFYSDQSYIARDFAEKLEFLEDTIENTEELGEISQGTMTAEALFTVRMYFSEKVKAENKAIVLISDLVDNLGPVAHEMRRALEDDIDLYVIAVTEDPLLAYQSIQILKSRIGSNRVQMVWFKEAEGINEIYEKIGKMKGSVAGEVEILSKKSLVPLILPTILGLFILSIILSETIFRKIP